MKQNPLNRYATEMAEINLSRNPTSTEAILVLCDQDRDHYQDAVSEENYRVKKRVVIKKSPDLHYVQFDGSNGLMEDAKNLPWTVSMTIKDIKHYVDDVLVECIPQTDDQLLIDGILYTISVVEPSNRFLDGIINCTVYPERSSQDDPLHIYRVDEIRTDVYSIIWGGFPTHYKLDDGEWLQFVSYFKTEDDWQTLTIKDKDGEEATFTREVIE